MKARISGAQARAQNVVPHVWVIPEDVSSMGGLPDNSAKCTSPESRIKLCGRARRSSSSKRRLAAGKCAHDSTSGFEVSTWMEDTMMCTEAGDANNCPCVCACAYGCLRDECVRMRVYTCFDTHARMRVYAQSHTPHTHTHAHTHTNPPHAHTPTKTDTL